MKWASHLGGGRRRRRRVCVWWRGVTVFTMGHTTSHSIHCFSLSFFPLSGYADEFIYSPWLAPASVQVHAGCRVGLDYPAPIIDHRTTGVLCCEKLRLVMTMLHQVNSSSSSSCSQSLSSPHHPLPLDHSQSLLPQENLHWFILIAKLSVTIFYLLHN